jgi:hypothetical protein
MLKISSFIVDAGVYVQLLLKKLVGLSLDFHEYWLRYMSGSSSMVLTEDVRMSVWYAPQDKWHKN